MLVTTTPIVLVRLVARLPGYGTGAKAAFCGDAPDPLRSFRVYERAARSARETVEWDTRAMRAMSLMEALLLPVVTDSVSEHVCMSILVGLKRAL